MPKPFNKTDNPGLPFPPRRSPNPAGRPPSIDRARRDVALELAKHGGTLTRLAVQRALAGDAQCLAACMALLAATAESRATAEKSSP
ncbi:hypothetical protein [Paraburkholderia solisilvae]|uniref:DUF5681 domain-containing protein n=1 Tax=Paraburkholderia solisilvae TaxID=624376 RepID=A0A6J5DIE1_9BURK|nr:hypothetical protein [Paraburkholderia solisilvae]CAB3753011.1 hypothetical protein LMG29739_01642 [Paraburkholderia solisilvae]